MNDEIGLRNFEEFSNLWQSNIDGRDFYGAIEVGIASYMFFRENTASQRLSGSLNLVAVAATMLLQDGKASVPIACSFCGRSESEVPLGAGPNAFICVDCATVFSNTLKRGAEPT
jgi:hypothetical protein